MRIFYLGLGLLLLLLPMPARADDISVFAASSLTGVLREAAQVYQKRHGDDQILMHFAGSQTLATQIEQGAPADLFISANTGVMARLEEEGLAIHSRLLLKNRLSLALRPGLEPQLTSIRDLARPDLLLVIGNPQVPIGNYTRILFKNIERDPIYGAQLVRDIKQNIVSEENQDKAIIAKLLLGEVDAGIVYRSDLAAHNARHLIAISLPQKDNPQACYPLAKIQGGKSATDKFIAFLFSDKAQQIFTRQGFQSGVEQ